MQGWGTAWWRSLQLGGQWEPLQDGGWAWWQKEEQGGQPPRPSRSKERGAGGFQHPLPGESPGRLDPPPTRRGEWRPLLGDVPPHSLSAFAGGRASWGHL